MDADVIDKEVVVENVSSKEFEFDNYSLVRVDNHWEIQFEDNEGAQSIIVQLQDFDEKGEFHFYIDEEEKIFLKSDFLNIEKFCSENHLV